MQSTNNKASFDISYRQVPLSFIINVIEKFKNKFNNHNMQFPIDFPNNTSNLNYYPSLSYIGLHPLKLVNALLHCFVTDWAPIQKLPTKLLKYSHTSFYELPLYETSELRNRFLEVTASTKNQQIW